MKKLILMALAALAIGCTIVLAGQVYSRDTKALGVTTGTATWTNSSPYASIALKRIWIENALITNEVVTIKRVTSNNAYTQAVGSVSCTTEVNGNTASFTAAYLADGDKLTFSSSIATGSTAVIEYEVQKH